MKKDAKQHIKQDDSFLSYIGNVLYSFFSITVRVLLIAAAIVTIYEVPDVFAWDDTINNYIKVNDNFYTDDISNKDTINQLDTFVEELPPIFVKEFKSCWRVIIEDNDNISYYNGNIVGGYTDWSSRTIYIQEQADFNDTLEIFAHELGHCLDFEYGSMSYSDWFNEIYETYKDTFSTQYTNSPDGYETSSAEEFFAACFEEYLLYPEHLKETAPKAYKFIDNYYEKLEKLNHIYIYDFGAVANTISRMAEQIK